MKTSVSILSDSSLFRETIAAWLRYREEFHLLAAAGSMHQLRQRLNGHATDVLLAHTSIKGVLGAELLWDTKTLLPATNLIVLGFRRNEQDLVRWIEAGAMAYLEQDATSAELLETIRGVARGGPRCSISLLTRVIDRFGRMTCKAAHFGGRPAAELFSDRELELAIPLPAGLLPPGLLNEQIGRQLGIKRIHGEDSSPARFRKTPDAAKA